MTNYEGTVLFYLLPANGASDDILEEDRVALQMILNDVRVFVDADQCVDELSCIVDETIFLFLGSGRSNLVSIFKDFSHLHYIYLSEPHSNLWTWQVRGVFPALSMFFDQLKKDVKTALSRQSRLCLTSTGDLCRNQASSENVEKDGIEYKKLYALHRILLSIDKPAENVYDDLLHESRLIYRHNKPQNGSIDEFESEYRPEKAIWWYTRESFVFKMVNMALRTKDIVLMWTFRYFIQDLHRQLKALDAQERMAINGKRQYTVYRGQSLSLDEFKQLQNSIGSVIVMHSFISTTQDRALAAIYAGNDRNPSTRAVLFKISVNESELGDDHQPFADISHLSAFESECEIMFGMGTLMRIQGIETDGCICLCLCRSDFLVEYDALLNEMEKLGTYKLAVENPKMFLLIILFMMGEWNKVQQMRVDLQSLDQTSISQFLHQWMLMIANCCDPQTMITDSYNCETMPNVIKLYLNPLQLLLPAQLVNAFEGFIQKTMELNQTVYQNFTDWSTVLQPLRHTLAEIERLKSECKPMYHFAFDCILKQGRSTIDFYSEVMTYDEFMSQSGQTSITNKNDAISVLLVRAHVLEQQGHYAKAVSLLEDMLSKIRDSTYAILLCRWLALLHDKHANWDAAIQYYERITCWSDQSPNSLDIIHAHICCGQRCLVTGNTSSALNNYNKALTLLQQHYPSTNPLVAEVYLGIGHSLERNVDFVGALENYTEVIKRAHLDAACQAHQKSGTIHYIMRNFDQARLHFAQCLSISDRQATPLVSTLALTYLNLCWIEHVAENYELRDYYIRQALDITADCPAWHFLVTQDVTKLMTSGHHLSYLNRS